MFLQGQQEGSAGKGACCCQSRWPEFEPQDPRGRRGELTLAVSCPLTNTRTTRHPHVPQHTCSKIIENVVELCLFTLRQNRHKIYRFYQFEMCPSSSGAFTAGSHRFQPALECSPSFRTGIVFIKQQLPPLPWPWQPRIPLSLDLEPCSLASVAALLPQPTVLMTDSYRNPRQDAFLLEGE